MTQRLKSTVLRYTNSVKHSTISDLRDSLLAARPTIGHDESYGSNEYIHKPFFERDNYQSILKCLDGGHDIAKDLIDYMEAYYNLERDHARELNSYTSKWKSKLKGQSSLSSYNTTKRAQIQTITAPETVTELIQTRCEAVQQVITTYRRLVERMYPTSHKHYRTDALKKSFKTARSAVSKVSDALDKLRTQEKRAQEALHDADVQCENLSFDPNPNKKKVSRAADEQAKKRDQLELVQEEIARTQKTFEEEQQTYRERAMEIYQECRELEKERLDQIQQTLIQFSQAVHTSEHSSALDQIYADLLSNIKTQQNTIEDLDFWAGVYHVTTPTKKSLANSTTTEGDTLPVVGENEEQQQQSTSADSTTTQAKAKPKKNKKNNAAGEPTTPNATESG